MRSYDIITAYINRIVEVNPYINAVVQERFKAALDEAQTVDNFISNTNLSEDELKLQKPLLGVPVTIKESCMLKGSFNY